MNHLAYMIMIPRLAVILIETEVAPFFQIAPTKVHLPACTNVCELA